MDKLILIDKPVGWTSFDVVAKIRSYLSKEIGSKVKVGHTGTLDPFASGLLIILAGKETKNQNFYMKQHKEYVATLRLGYESSTGDTEGKIKKTYKIIDQSPNIKDVQKVLESFIGKQNQIPPIYSAVKINGERAYKKARSGDIFTLVPRQIEIKKIEILDYQFPTLKIKINCSSGTYIRTLAYDIGRSLKTGAYLTGLRRTKIGNFNITDAKTMSDLNHRANQIGKTDEITKLVQVIKDGGVAVVPTDTLYGIVGQAKKKKTVSRIYKLKDRDPQKPFIILLSNVSELNMFNIKLNQNLKNAQKNYWPGAFSLIFSCQDSKFGYLHRGTNKLAFRIPDDEVLRDIIAKTGPLVAPSANPEGLKPAESVLEAKKYFREDIDFYLDGGLRCSKASKIIDLTEKEPKIIRA